MYVRVTEPSADVTLMVRVLNRCPPDDSTELPSVTFTRAPD